MKTKEFVAIAVCACCSALFSAQLAWQNQNAIYQSGTSTALSSGTVYLIDGRSGNGGIDRQELWTTIYGGTTVNLSDYTWYSATLTANSKFSAVADTNPDNEETHQVFDGQIILNEPCKNTSGKSYSGKEGDFYQVVQVGDMFYFSEVLTETVLSTGGGDLSYMNSNSKLDVSTSATLADAGGWYKVKAVPEPTSGLLMLVGMGLLGLRRKRRA